MAASTNNSKPQIHLTQTKMGIIPIDRPYDGSPVLGSTQKKRTVNASVSFGRQLPLGGSLEQLSPA